MNRFIYALHRWIALAVALQLLAWAAGGLLFSILDIDDVHGNLDRVEVEHGPLGSPLPITADAALATAGVARKASLVVRRGRPEWEIELQEGGLVLIDARTGARVPQVAEEEARQIASAGTRGAKGVLSAKLIERDPPLEYREKPLPAWQVVLDHDKGVHVYVHALTGEITARRNAKWRLWDFFWMLHVMDYRGREDFQHPLLAGFAALAVLTSASGLVLWGARFRRRVRQERGRKASGSTS